MLLDSIFSSISPLPIAAASLGQVSKAELKYLGKTVAVKPCLCKDQIKKEMTLKNEALREKVKDAYAYPSRHPPLVLRGLKRLQFGVVGMRTAVLLSQLPNLNSMAGDFLVGAINYITYRTLIWVVSMSAGRLLKVSYNRVGRNTRIERTMGVLNALEI
ncbi:hypothetical protein REPUB_Repub17cG0077900 [Reevesia pubescens]